MSRYFVGGDVGGTKTHLLIADEAGQALGFGRAGPGNPEGVGYAGLTQALRSALGEALAAASLENGQIEAGGFGIAGFDWPSQREQTLSAVRPLGLRAPIEIVNDAVLGILGGARNGWGVAVVAGTGCNCRGLDAAGREGRVTGFGYPMGEGAGAGEVVDRGIEAVSRAWSQRGPSTRLTQAFADRVGARDAAGILWKASHWAATLWGRKQPPLCSSWLARATWSRVRLPYGPAASWEIWRAG